MIYLVTTQQELFESTEYTIINAEESLQLLNDCKALQYDSETDGIDSHINKILSIQFGNKEKDFQIVVDASTIDISIYKEILESKFIIGHNLKFDLQFLYNYSIIPRKVYDTMIVEQLLHLGYPAGIISYSLASVARRLLNIDIDKSVRGQIIWRGLDTEVIKYAANDVVYLEDIMGLQIAECREKNCLIGAKLECDFVPSIAYLEWCGIKLSESKWRAKMNEDNTKLLESKEALDEYLIADSSLSKYTKVNLQGSLFDGFDTKPKCIINWDSSQQVIKVAKDLGFNTSTQDKKTGEDKDSVLEKHLKGQKGINDKFLDLYFTYKEYSKVCSTYGQSYLNAINPNTGRIHSVFRQLGAASGRMACGSKQPNDSLARLKKLSPKECVYVQLQNLPSDEKTRASFVPEDGNIFASIDYSAAESRLGADIYNEKSMIEEFLHGSGDIHSLVAKACFPDILKDLSTEEIKSKYPHLRKKAKPVGFAKQFGGSASAIAQSLGCTIEEAQTIADAYDNHFSGITKFAKVGSKFVRQNGYVLICKYTGHKMFWWDHQKWLDIQKSFTSDFWEEYRNYHKGTGDLVAQEVKEHFQAASKWDRMALNAPTQGTLIIIVKDATTRFFNWIVDNGLFGKVKLCNIVHDEINIEYPKELENTSKILEKMMEESAYKYCKSLPIPAVGACGDHWIH